MPCTDVLTINVSGAARSVMVGMIVEMLATRTAVQTVVS